MHIEKCPHALVICKQSHAVIMEISPCAYHFMNNDIQSRLSRVIVLLLSLPVSLYPTIVRHTANYNHLGNSNRKLLSLLLTFRYKRPILKPLNILQHSILFSPHWPSVTKDVRNNALVRQTKGSLQLLIWTLLTPLVVHDIKVQECLGYV